MKPRKCITFMLLILVQLLPFTSWSQAVFAPIKGAEWNYHFKSNNYDWNIPFYKPIEGIVTVKYTKDTLILGSNFKKFEQSEKWKYKGNDTLYTFTRQSLFMIQRNDTVFLLNKDTLAVAFVYKTTIGSVTNLRSMSRNIFSIELTDTTYSTSINQSNLKFKKFSYKTIILLVDVLLENPLIFLDRIGPLNADITVINSQASSNSEYYRLVCYSDSEVGQLKFLNRDCNVTTSIITIKEPDFNNFFIALNSNNLLIRLSNINEYITNILFYDIQGRLIQDYAVKSPVNEVLLPSTFLKTGLYLISLKSNLGIYKTKKVFIN